MDLRLVVAVSALLLVKVECEPNITQTTTASPLRSNTTTSPNCPCSGPEPPVASTPTPRPGLGVLTVKWKGELCKGDVLVTLLSSPMSSPMSPMHLCYDNLEEVKGLLSKVCEMTKGCQGESHKWTHGEELLRGFNLTLGEEVSCKALKVHCTVLKVPSVPKQQQESGGYKVATVLLCLVLVALLLIRFTKPTVKALQKRLSDRRQSRWIGPTQSQSVSYHRGKAAAQNNDGDKRLSYPALERLAVSTSREPSSNRNSDYNY